MNKKIPPAFEKQTEFFIYISVTTEISLLPAS